MDSAWFALGRNWNISKSGFNGMYSSETFLEFIFQVNVHNTRNLDLFDKLGRVGRGGCQGTAITFFDSTNPMDRFQAKLFVNELEIFGQPVPEVLKAIVNIDQYEW